MSISIIHAELLTPEELAERLKLPVSWIYEHCRERALNRLPGFKLGKYWRFREAGVPRGIEGATRGFGASLTPRPKKIPTQTKAPGAQTEKRLLWGAGPVN